MNVSKKVYEAVVEHLRREANDATYELTKNKRAIKELAEKQRLLKATKTEIFQMIRDLTIKFERTSDGYLKPWEKGGE